MMQSGPWQSLTTGLEPGSLIIVGPGAAVPLPVTLEQKHVPPGTAILLAEGAALANGERNVVVLGGDEDLYGAGLGDLLHAARRNTPITCIVRDNGTGESGANSRSEGPYPMHGLGVAVAAGATYVAQVAANDRLGSVVQAASHHVGFGLVNVLDRHPEKVRSLTGEEGYDAHALQQALPTAADPADAVPIGLIYHNPDRHPFRAKQEWDAPIATERWLDAVYSVAEGGENEWA